MMNPTWRTGGPSAPAIPPSEARIGSKRKLLGRSQGRPAAEFIDPLSVSVLSVWRYGEERPLTVREYVLALGRLGGHLNRKGDGAPGWLVLWRGWQKLHLMVEGARAADHARAKPLRIKRNKSP